MSTLTIKHENNNVGEQFYIIRLGEQILKCYVAPDQEQEALAYFRNYEVPTLNSTLIAERPIQTKPVPTAGIRAGQTIIEYRGFTVTSAARPEVNSAFSIYQADQLVPHCDELTLQETLDTIDELLLDEDETDENEMPAWRIKSAKLKREDEARRKASETPVTVYIVEELFKFDEDVDETRVIKYEDLTTSQRNALGLE